VSPDPSSPQSATREDPAAVEGSARAGRARRRSLLKLGAAGVLALVLPQVTRLPAGIDDPQIRGPDSAPTLRFDFEHALEHGTERFAITRVRAEGVSGGARAGATPSGWGDYRLSIHDGDSGALVFQTGFDTTLDRIRPPARAALSVRCPGAARFVHLAIERRRTESVYQELWSERLDLAHVTVDRSPPALPALVETLLSSGAPQSKVDIAILGDGYRETDYAKFEADAKRAAAYLFSIEPFSSRLSDFNVYTVFSPSRESGVTDAYLGIERDTALRCAYYAGGSERALAAGDNTAVREIAAAVPYDFLLILANARRYGGSAYFGGPAVAAIDSAAARYLVIHEFAHVIGGLTDEYYIPTAYGPTFFGNIEPWQPNVTLRPGENKWGAHVSADTPQPTPWNKSEYERYFSDYVNRYRRLRATRAEEAAVERFMREEAARQRALLSRHVSSRIRGYYEGANGYAKGVYRSEVDCIMFSLQTQYFCAACAAAIERMIDLYCR
jgi:hypothetical protein